MSHVQHFPSIFMPNVNRGCQLQKITIIKIIIIQEGQVSKMVVWKGWSNHTLGVRVWLTTLLGVSAHPKHPLEVADQSLTPRG
jgi:hypothetical protein